MAQYSKLKINMLGGFSLILDGKDIIPEGSGKNKVLYFLEYIMANRHRSVPQQELIDTILANDDCGDPINTLKNLVYRSRKIFKEAGLPEKDYIYCSRGTYGFSPDVDCSIDTEDFEKYINTMVKTSDNKRALTAGLKAIEIYNGSFLPFSYEQIWSIPLSVKYQDMFILAIQKTTEILMENEDYEHILSLTEKAISLYAYNETFHIIRITALYNMGNIKNAISEYEEVTAILFDELGVTPSDELLAIYAKATKSMAGISFTVQEALDDIMAEPSKECAFYCSYYMFSNTCRFLARHIARNGLSAFLILCTLKHKNNEPLSTEQHKKASETFHKAIGRTLRQSDIYTRCSTSQFLVLLLGSNQENAKRVMSRANAAFKKIIENQTYASVFNMHHKLIYQNTITLQI